jgi:hypothetical protein
MIERTLQHQIDTKAVREVITQFDADWIIRSQEDRDYGIDLTIERFDGKNPTGDFIFVQVKGTNSDFGDKVQLSGFPTKTILYSQLFNVPFFVFYTSCPSKKTRFVWLQKYADIKLPRTSLQWKTQDTVTIYFPKENELNTNKRKLIAIINKDKNKKLGVKFLAIYESLKFHSESVMLGITPVAEYCYEATKSLLLLKHFISSYTIEMSDENTINIDELCDTYQEIYETNNITIEAKNIIVTQLELLEAVKFTFLNDDDSDDFAVEMNAYEPY